MIERLTIDRALRRICGFSSFKPLPSEATFSRAFAEFAKARLAERVHEALIKKHLGEQLIGHLRVRGNLKVMSHLMFGILALSADQLMRLLL